MFGVIATVGLVLGFLFGQVPAETLDPALITIFVDGVINGNYWLAAAAGLSICTFVLRQIIAKRFAWWGTLLGSTVLLVLTNFAGAFLSALVAGEDPTNLAFWWAIVKVGGLGGLLLTLLRIGAHKLLPGVFPEPPAPPTGEGEAK